MLGRIALIALCLPIAACASGSVERGSERFQGGVGTAATAPLDDLNLRREEIPEILTQARQLPYAVNGLSTCAALTAEVTKLDEVLGDDVDVANANAVPVETQAADAALGVVRDTASDLIPMRSWVRRLSGAHAHSLEVQEAIRAGTARRGFLKGVAEARGCNRA